MVSGQDASELYDTGMGPAVKICLPWWQAESAWRGQTGTDQIQESLDLPHSAR